MSVSQEESPSLQGGEDVKRNEMILALGEDCRVYDERRLEKVISRLRKKLSEKWGLAPIKAVRNKGYVYAAPIRILS